MIAVVCNSPSNRGSSVGPEQRLNLKREGIGTSRVGKEGSVPRKQGAGEGELSWHRWVTEGGVRGLRHAGCCFSCCYPQELNLMTT